MTLVRSIDSNRPLISQSPVSSSSNTLPMKSFLIMLGGALLLGVIGGWALGHGKGETVATTTNGSGTSEDGVPKTAGIADTKTYKDNAEGVLKEGGIDGEGSYHLVRGNDESQYAYLTSDTVDLSKYIDKKIRVHGVTIAGQKAGWFMNVGYVELLQ